MSKIVKHQLFWPMVFVLALIAIVTPVIVVATTAVTYDKVVGAVTQEVGGVPVCVTFQGTSASSAEDIVVTLPTGFVPTWVRFIPDFNAAAPAGAGVGITVYEWMYGMPADTAVSFQNNTTTHTPALYYNSTTDLADGITAAAGTITIVAERQVNSGNFIGRACR